MYSKCYKSFENSKQKKLLYLSLHFLDVYGFNMKDLISKISEHYVFNFEDHVGGFIPLYYSCGLPCRTWICVNCKEQFSEANDDSII